MAVVTVEIVIGITTGKIVRIGCNSGYLGKTTNNLSVGMDLNSALQQEPKFIKRNNFLQLKKHLGLLLEIPNRFDDLDYVNELPNFTVENISVVPVDSDSVMF